MLRLKADPPISQDDLVGRLAAQGVLLDRTAISRIEHQQRYLTDFEAIAIARALKLDPSELFKGAKLTLTEDEKRNRRNEEAD